MVQFTRPAPPDRDGRLPWKIEQEEQMEEISGRSVAKIIGGIVFAIAGTVGLGMWGCPQYNVYSSRASGEAKLAEAEFSRQVAVREAIAERDSAKMHAQAEVERAKGVAAANHIIGKSLDGKEDYLRYLYINNLKGTRNQVIYVPTEAGLPILEAGKRRAAAQ
jgi:hypothetical protein